MTDKIDPEINDLLHKKSEEQGVPYELLRKIYLEEKRVVNMDMRQDIHQNIKKELENHVDEWSP